MAKRLLIPKGEKFLDKAIDSDTNEPFFKKGEGLPFGIINKTYTGIGATTIQLKAKFNTIMVFPFRNLAWEKYELIKDKAIYVGTKPDTEGAPTTLDEIKQYHESSTPKVKKIIVVANSIYKIRKAIGDEVFEKYHLVLDEVEILQMQSSFRKSLAQCMDEFKQYKDKTLVTATPLIFHDKEIAELDHFTVQNDYASLHKLNFTKSNSPINSTLAYIQSIIESKPGDKFFIALNSTKAINEFILLLKKKLPKIIYCALLGESSKEAVLPSELGKINLDGSLPAQVNLATSAYFSGIDVHDKFHAIAISLDTRKHHSLSFENYVQFFGRGRENKKPNVVFSRSIYIQYPFPPNRLKPIRSYEGIKKRTDEFEKLFKYIPDNISNDRDSDALLEALNATKTVNPVGLIFQGFDELPKVNYLAQDLELYQQLKYEDYSDEFKNLISKLKKRFTVSEQTDSILVDIPNLDPNAKLDIFLEWVKIEYESRKYFFSILQNDKFSTFKKPIALLYFLALSIHPVNGFDFIEKFCLESPRSIRRRVLFLMITIKFFNKKKSDKVYTHLEELSNNDMVYADDIRKAFYVYRKDLFGINFFNNDGTTINTTDVVMLCNTMFDIRKLPTGGKETKIRYKLNSPVSPFLQKYSKFQNELRENITQYSTIGIDEYFIDLSILSNNRYSRPMDIVFDYERLLKKKQPNL